VKLALLAKVTAFHAPLGQPIQSKSGTAVGTSITVSFDSQPKVGNLLIACVGSNDGDATNPANWTTAVNKVNVTDDDFIRIAYRVAGVAESLSVAFTGFVGNNQCLSIAEFDVTNASPSDVSSSAGETIGATSQTSGTTAATAQNSEISVACWAARAAISAISLSNGFSILHSLSNSISFVSGFKIETASGAKESTMSWTTAGNSIGAIATFKI